MSESKSVWVINTSPQNFQDDVFLRSHDVPVVVDFWAEWCAPCRALGPVLEQLAADYDGRFELVKADVDQLPEAAAEFQVQGIPAVFAVVGGEVVEYFTGALPKSQIVTWLDRILTQGELASANKLADTDPPAAETKFRVLIGKMPQSSEPQIGLAKVLFAQNRRDETLAVIETLQKRGFLEPEAEKIRAALELKGANVGNVADLKATAAADPNNFELQLQLAEALAANGEYEPALIAFLTLVQRDRQKTGEKAKQFMVDIFRVLPADSELTSTYRRKLSSALY